MPRVFYGTKNEPSFELKESPDLIAVRTRSKRSALAASPVMPPTAAEVQDGELVVEFPDAGVEVYRVPVKKRSLEARKQSLAADPDVRFAGSVLVHSKTEEPVIYTENIYIRFQENVDPEDCERIIREAGLTVKQQLDFAVNAYFVAAAEGIGQKVFDIASELLQRPEVMHCHPEIVQTRQWKQIFAPQWHLKPTTINSTAVNAHVNVEAAHALTRGAGITIAVIDDGVDIDHPEFSGAGKIIAPRDATLQTSNPRPVGTSSKHGTACAGVACASGIDGASGVAPAARLMPIRLASALGSIREAEAFKWAADNGADIISCSWGPADGAWFDPSDPSHAAFAPLPASTRAAIDYAVTNGRGGKGCVVFFAAGNGNESVDNDGYASYQNVIAVAACNDRSKRSVYSDFGKAVWCSFPSSDFGHVPFGHPNPLTTGIWTTDRAGSAGYNPGNASSGDLAGNYTNSFGGTSSACPGAAGVAALVLSTHAGLRWDEVKKVLRSACDRIDPTDGKYDADGHSDFYGYGRLNAETAVKLAKSSVGRLFILNKLLNEPIPDLGFVVATIDMTDTTPIEGLEVSVRLTHTYIGDLNISLIPPPGRGLSTVVLHKQEGGSKKNLDRQYAASSIPGLAGYKGKKCNGTWTIRVEDRAAQDSGVLVQVGLQFSLPPAVAPSPTTPIATTPVLKSAKAPKKSARRKMKRSVAKKRVKGAR